MEDINCIIRLFLWSKRESTKWLHYVWTYVDGYILEFRASKDISVKKWIFSTIYIVQLCTMQFNYLNKIYKHCMMEYNPEENKEK